MSQLLASEKLTEAIERWRALSDGARRSIMFDLLEGAREYEERAKTCRSSPEFYEQEAAASLAARDLLEAAAKEQP